MSFLRNLLRFLLLAGTLWPVQTIRADTVWGTATGSCGTNTTQLLLILDDVSGLAYVQMSGPADAWFSWGFGASTMSGTYAIVSGASVNERKLGNHNPGTQLTNSFNLLTSCTDGNQRFISLSRPLSGASSSYYTFSTGQSSIPLIWAIGVSTTFAYEGSSTNHGAMTVTNLAVSNSPPGFASAAVGGGMVVLSLTNVFPTFTNYLDTSTNLNSSSSGWTPAQILTSPTPCGSLMLGYVTNLAIPVTNNASYFRVRR